LGEIKESSLHIRQLKNIKPELLIIIPARNEEKALSQILKNIIPSITSQVVVVDNGSTDRTTEVSQKIGGIVIRENRLGYGSACLAGIRYVASLPKPPELICFFDGDAQSFVEDILKVAYPVLTKKVEYCQGSRMVHSTSRYALSSTARLANRFFSRLLSLLWKQPITDLGPLRCLSWDSLSRLNMTSTGYGWTTEMSAKIMKSGIIHHEVPVRYRKRRTGQSKISGSLKTAIRAVFVMSLTLLHVMILWRPTSAN